MINFSTPSFGSNNFGSNNSFGGGRANALTNIAQSVVPTQNSSTAKGAQSSSGSGILNAFKSIFGYGKDAAKKISGSIPGGFKDTAKDVGKQVLTQAAVGAGSDLARGAIRSGANYIRAMRQDPATLLDTSGIYAGQGANLGGDILRARIKKLLSGMNMFQRRRIEQELRRRNML